MSKLFTILIFIFACLGTAHSQKHDILWLLSYNSINVGGKSCIDFTTFPADTFLQNRKLGSFITNASICDSSGNLLFYTNGIYVANKEHDTLWNSGDFNPGYASDYYWYFGLGFSQGAIIIPEPDQTDKYLIFHVSGDEFEAYGENQLQPQHLGMSEVDMALDGGLGGIPVDKKDLHIIEDTITQGRLTSVKHANGRDWWVVTHKFYSDVFYKVLVQPDTVTVYSQAVGPIQTSNDILGMAKFSSDGSKYCYLNHYLTFDLFDFDRCTGEFSNPVTYTVPDTSDLPLTQGCEFSGSGQFLYVNTYKGLYQYDLWSPDIQESVIKIAEWDTTYLPTATWFFLPQRAPDGKIYISTYNGTKYLHVIDQPDSLGLACNFTQHTFDLPEYSSPIPNFPNYQLGKFEGSPCDTLFSDVEHIASHENKGLSLAPNPAMDRVEVNYRLDDEALLTITDMYGKAVLLQMLYPYFTSRIIYTNHLPEGMYQVTLMQGDHIIATEKLVLQR